MPINVAKLLVSIGADTDNLEAGLQQSNQGVNSFGKNAGLSLAKVGAAFTAVTAVAAGFAVAWNKAMEIGREGAELEYAAQKFDRLTMSIGAASDALMIDLRAATRGTMSDAQLMASAGDLMALGLAKTYDQVVRLTRVSSGLNMDMNQLVLTLANQTTMRFDQLGVSVDGFQAKVDKLKASGMSANDAFSEAFLQQAEQQLETVGNSADTSVGAFKRLDAAMANFVDSLKTSLTPALATAANAAADLIGGENDTSRLVDNLKTQERGIRSSSKSFEDYIDTLIDTAINQGLLTESFREAYATAQETGDVDRLRMAFETLTSQMGMVDEITWKATRGMEEYADTYDRWAEDVRGKTVKPPDIDIKDSGFYEAIAASVQPAKNELDSLIAKVAETQGVIDAWLQGTGALAGQILGQNIWEGSQMSDDMLGIIDKVYGTAQLKAKELERGLTGAIQNAVRTGDLEAFEAALVAIREEGLAEWNKEMDANEKRIGEITKKLEALPEEVRVAIKFDIDALPQWIIDLMGGGDGSGSTGGQGNAPRATGGPVWPGQSYLVGERGYEIFQPSGPGYIVPNSQAARGAGGAVINNYGVISTSGDDPLGSQLLAVLV